MIIDINMKEQTHIKKIPSSKAKTDYALLLFLLCFGKIVQNICF